jgi:surface polysaccharide O-acyltransferase-like enzyme
VIGVSGCSRLRRTPGEGIDAKLTRVRDNLLSESVPRLVRPDVVRADAGLTRPGGAPQFSVMQRAALTLPAPSDRAHEIDRVRVLASSTVVLLHAAWTPATAMYAHLGVASRELSSLLLLATGANVPAFLFVTFLLLERRRSPETPYVEVLRGRCASLLPPYLLWSTLYLVPKLATGQVRASVRTLVEVYILGDAAAHLYFIPSLLALIAASPLLRWIASRTWVAAICAVTCPLLAAHLMRELRPTSAWFEFGLGVLGNVCYPVAALTLGRLWGDTRPPARWRGASAVVSLLVAGIGAGVIYRLAVAESLAAAPILPTLLERLALVGYAIAMPCLLIATARVPAIWTRTIAPLTFGIYLGHPMFVKALQLAESQVALPAGWEGALMIPNGLCALAGSAALASWAQTHPRLRRAFGDRSWGSTRAYAPGA